MASSSPKASSCVLLTGVTGFLGKVVLEELFRRRDEYALSKVIVLARGKRDRDPQTRFREDVATSKCFSLLAPHWVDAVEVVAGDLSEHQCGLDDATYARVCGETTHIIHCAASVDFVLPVAEAARANITSSMNVLALAKKIPKLKRFVSTSTSYVTAFRTGPIHEVLAPLPRPATELLRDIETGHGSEKSLLASTGHANTYTFTKCIAEHLLMENRGNVPLTIVRPSIISASWKHPFPGWIDSKAAFAGFVATIGGGLMHVIDADPDALLDIVPVDEVAARLIDQALVVDVPQGTSPIIYAVASLAHGSKVRTCTDTITKYFGRHRSGRRSSLQYIGRRNLKYKFHTFVQHDMPAKLAKTYFGLRGDSKMQRRTERMASTLEAINDVFPYFTHNTFDFRPSVPLPEDFDVPSYLALVCRGVHKHLMGGDATQVLLGGKAHKSVAGDVVWCLGKPDGNLAIRMSAVTLRKVLRKIFDEVTFDQQSFDRAVELAGKDGHLVIVPTHRSYVDFLVCSYLFFARPDLGISIPYIAAAQEFAEVPGIGWWFKRMHAFYLRRGAGKADPQVSNQVHDLIEEGKTLQFFVEGQRSRSRQFLAPHRGLLRSLQSTGKRFAVLPVSISYDRVPEETPFLRELKGYPKEKMLLRSLARWAGRMARNEVQLGRMHIRCGDPLMLDADTDVHGFSRQLMEQLQANTVATSYHLQCFVQRHTQSGLTVSWLQDAIEKRGGVVLKSAMSERQVLGLDPVLERCLRHHWMHLFFDEALRQAGKNPALSHYIEENGYSRGNATPAARVNDARLATLLFHLFEPVCADYAAVARTVLRSVGNTRAIDGEQVLRQTAYADYATAKAALRGLEKRGLLTASTRGKEHFHVAGRASDFHAFIEACALKAPKTLKVAGWA